jgi:hypothetical protein
MAAYTQQGAAVQTGGFGQIAPSAVDPNSAFELLGKAFKQGLISSAEINEAINVVPAEQRTRQIEARNKAEQAQSDIRLRPELEPLKVEEAKLRNKELSIKIDDPLGLKQYAAKELLQVGKTPTGDVTKDMEALSTHSKEKAEQARKLVVLDTLQKKMLDYDVDFTPDPDAPIDAEINRGRAAYSEAKKKREKQESDDKVRGRLEKEAEDLGVGFSEYSLLDLGELSNLVAKKNAEETRKKETGSAKPSEGQQKASIYVKELEQTRPVIDELERKGYQPSVKDKFVEKFVPDAFQSFVNSDEAQSWQAAKDKWIEAVLRERSGAAIAKTEYGNADKQYFPQPGDAPSVVVQKRALRAAAEEAMRATFENGGKGIFYDQTGTAQPVDPSTPASPAAPAPAPTASPAAPQPAKVLSFTADGKTTYYIPDPTNPQRGIVTDSAGVPLP